MIFNTIIKGKGGITGEPIVVSELPTPTEKDVGKVYLYKDLKIPLVVGEPVGDKIYFDTTKNPAELIAENGSGSFVMSNGTTYIWLGLMDYAPAMGLTDGHLYAVFLSDKTSALLGLAYLDTDNTFTLEQVNEMLASAFGAALTHLGWQTDVIDTSAYADWTVAEINNLANYDNIAYLGTKDIDEVEGEYYVGKNASFEVGTPIGNKICFDITKKPADYMLDGAGEALLLQSADDTQANRVMLVLGEMLGGGDNGNAYMVMTVRVIEGVQEMLLAYAYCDVLTVEQFNEMIGSQFGVSITAFGWQMDEMDTSAVADTKVISNNIANYGYLAYGAPCFEKIHIDEINELTAENTSLTEENILLTNTITEQEATIAEKEATIAEKEATIAEKEATIAEKELAINRIIEGTITEINSDVYSIRTGVCGECRRLTTAKFPNATSIGHYAFYECDALTIVDIPNAISIGDLAFYGCDALATVDFPKVTSISNNALGWCKKLTTVNFPNVTSIGSHAFYGSFELTTVNFPNVTSIGGAAFYGCNALTSVDFPKVTGILTDAFRGCTGLTTLDLPSIKVISDSGFEECTGLTIVNLWNVTNIHASAFKGCTGLTTVIINATTPPTLITNAFTGCTALTAIYVPAESVDAYKAASGWNTYADIIQANPNTTATVTVNYTVDGHDHGVMGDTAPETVAYGSDFAFQVDCEQGYAVDTSSIIVTGATLAYTQTVYEPDGVTVVPESLFLAFTDVTGDVTINMTLRQY